MMAKKKPSRKQVVEKILNSITEPIKADELVEKILKRYKSTAKNPKRAIRSYLRELDGKELIFEDMHTIVPMEIAMQGIRYYITLDEIPQQGVILSDVFCSFIPWHVKNKVQLLDASHQKLDYKEVQVKMEKQSPLDLFGYLKASGYSLESWFKQNKITPEHIILISIVDWNKLCFSLDVGTRESIKEENNQKFADIVFNMLEKANNEYIDIQSSIATAYYLLGKENRLPCEYWRNILTNDGRMVCDRTGIQYADSLPFLEMFEENAYFEEPCVSEEEGRKVYCFKAYLKYKDTIWRTFQIQGEQTLVDLHYYMIELFDYDLDSSYISSFWKCIQRGKNKRKYREVEISRMSHFDNGEDTPIAALEISVGDRLKYVYYDKERIEHMIELQEVTEPQEIEYPIEIQRNKPEYQYCSKCKQVAIYVCYTHSQKESFVCDGDCLEEYEACYLEKIIY